MDKGTSNNSSVKSADKLAHCACCHEFGQVRPHWDHPEVNLCEPCRCLVFYMTGHGQLTHTAYAFMNRLSAGGL